MECSGRVSNQRSLTVHSDQSAKEVQGDQPVAAIHLLKTICLAIAWHLSPTTRFACNSILRNIHGIERQSSAALSPFVWDASTSGCCRKFSPSLTCNLVHSATISFFLLAVRKRVVKGGTHVHLVKLDVRFVKAEEGGVVPSLLLLSLMLIAAFFVFESSILQNTRNSKSDVTVDVGTQTCVILCSGALESLFPLEGANGGDSRQ